MAINQELMKSLIAHLREAYPEQVWSNRSATPGQGTRELAAVSLYLQQQEIIDSDMRQVSDGSGDWRPFRMRLTAKGIDATEDDGSFKHAPAAVTVRLDDAPKNRGQIYFPFA